MPADSSVINFRVTTEERDLLRAVANFRGETLSSFIKASALASARRQLAEVGPEAVMEGDRKYEDERRSAAERQLEERLDALRRQLVDERDEEAVEARRRR